MSPMLMSQIGFVCFRALISYGNELLTLLQFIFGGQIAPLRVSRHLCEAALEEANAEMLRSTRTERLPC